MTFFSILAALPSLLSAYFMICRLNAKRRHILSFEGWAYLMMLGGSIFTFYTVFSYDIVPGMGKLMLDIGICLYFGQRGWRSSKLEKRNV